jgi:hypothetical protein
MLMTAPREDKEKEEWHRATEIGITGAGRRPSRIGMIAAQPFIYSYSVRIPYKFAEIF